jgi:hypothetical protein
MTQQQTTGSPDGHPREAWVRRRPALPLRWRASPVELALLAAGRHKQTGALPGAFCAEVGRRMLLAQADFSQWVLRRVETVTFQGDRSVLREITVDLRVREDAPVFVDDQGHEYWLVPIAIMWRRTLVDFHMSDEEGRPLSLPGLRLTQQLDQAVLLAAAAASAGPGTEEAGDDEVRAFVQQLVAGEHARVRENWKSFKQTGPDETGALARLRRSPVFYPVARRLRASFNLYAFLDVEDGRHRLLRMSFVEPIRWPYQVATLKPGKGDDVGAVRYRTRQSVPWRQKHERWLATFGLAPTRIRFQVPTAERAASYHFELVAPEGVRIHKATLLAGRPNESGRPSTEDHVENDTLTVGLHGVEVPAGSLCRVQIQLRVQSAGWLAVMALSALAISLVLLSVVWHLETQEAGQGSEQYNNVVVLLVTTAAAAATFVAHREFSGVAARLLVGVRAIAAVCIALPVIASGFIAYTERRPTERPEPLTADAIMVLFVVAVCLTIYLATVWWLSWRGEQAQRIRSPWDMTEATPPRLGWGRLRPTSTGRARAEERAKARARAERIPSESFDEAVGRHGFRRPAIGLASSEAWHQWYDVTNSCHESTLRELDGILGPQTDRPAFQCADPTRCPRKDDCLVLPRSGTVGHGSPGARADTTRRRGRPTA